MSFDIFYYLEEKHGGKWIAFKTDWNFVFLFRGPKHTDLSRRLHDFIENKEGNPGYTENYWLFGPFSYGASWMTLPDFITWCDKNKINELSPKFTEKLKEFRKEGVEQRIIWMFH